MIRMSLDKEPILPPEAPVKVSPVFTVPASLSEQPQLTKPRPLVQPKNGLQSSGGGQHGLLAPPPPGQRIGKRRFSMGVGFRGATKRRRRANSDSQAEPVLPSHFMLGGNIFDPLNLNSLLDEDVNRATNQETPKCSPLPSKSRDPVEILVPRDITDPLNLKGGEEAGEVAGVLLSPQKSRRRHRYRHHGGGGADGEKEAVPARLFPPPVGLTVPLTIAEGSVSASPLSCELNTAITCRDDVAPPPILPRRHTHPPQGPAQKPGSHGDGRHRKRRRTTSTRSADSSSTAVAAAPPPLPIKFQTPLVGGAKAGRCGEPLLGSAFLPQKKKKDKHRYQYGNHSRYYGYQGFYGDQYEGRVGVEEDLRLRLLEADWFRDKTVLDVGCGAGHMTLAIAKRFNPAHILGVELDETLVHAAKQNIRHFMSHDLVVEERERTGRRSLTRKEKKEGGEEKEEKVEEGGEEKEEEVEKVGEEKEERVEEGGEEKEEKVEKVKEQEKMEEEAVMKEFQQALSLLSFPLSFRVGRGPLSAPPLLLPPSSSFSRFPNNITFIQGDYVSEREVWPGRGHYDVIMCLGVTKWVQLQSGDGGVVRLFRRAYQSLSLGGLFILEPQPWTSYIHSKRASVTPHTPAQVQERTLHHYRSLRLRPEQFTSFLTDSVGFSSYRLLKNTGNQRPIYLFHKGAAHKK